MSLTVHKSKLLTCVLGSIVALSISTVATAKEDLLEKIKANKEVVVAHSNEAPNAYVDSKGEFKGVIVDLVRHAFKQIDADIEVTGRRIDWAGLIPALQAERVDMLSVGMYATPPRCEQVLFSEPLFVAGQRIVYKKGNPKNIKDFSSFKDNPDLKFAMLAGAFEEPYLRSMGIKDSQFVILPDSASMNSALMANRVDAMSVTGTASQWILEQYSDNFEGTEILYNAGEHDIGGYFSLQYRFGDETLKEAIDKALADFLGTDEFYELLSSYGIQDMKLSEKTIDQICKGE